MLDGDAVSADQAVTPGVCCAPTGIEFYDPPTPPGWQRVAVPLVGAGTEDDPRRPDLIGLTVAHWVLVYERSDDAVVDYSPTDGAK